MFFFLVSCCESYYTVVPTWRESYRNHCKSNQQRVHIINFSNHKTDKHVHLKILFYTQTQKGQKSLENKINVVNVIKFKRYAI